MSEHGSAPQGTAPAVRSRAGWNLLWTVPVAIAADVVLFFMALFAVWGDPAANERAEGYLLSHAWVWLSLMGPVTFAAVAVPPWNRSLLLRTVISAAIAIVVTAAVTAFVVL
jgi:hypothetical protein